MNSILPPGEDYRVVYRNDDKKIVGYIVRRQCYVTIPKGHIYHGKNDDEINSSDFPSVHGNVTWSASFERTKTNHEFKSYPEIDQDSWIIGWDYNHFGNMKQMMEGLSYGVKPTLELLQNECISVCKYCADKK